YRRDAPGAPGTAPAPLHSPRSSARYANRYPRPSAHPPESSPAPARQSTPSSPSSGSVACTALYWRRTMPSSLSHSQRTKRPNMRTSQYLLSTLKETPSDAVVISHQLLLRAGMIRKLASGLYTWLPLGLRALRKAEAIVRDEMTKAG